MPGKIEISYVEDEEDVVPERKESNIRQFVAICFLTFASILLFTAFLASSHIKALIQDGQHPTTITDASVSGLPVQQDNRGTYIQCPRDRAQRDAANCSFDLLLNGWFPSPCFDAELHHDYVDGHDYSFFYDFNATQRVPQSEIMQGDVDLYPDGLWVSFNEHINHCEYLLTASFRALAQQESGIADVFLAPFHMSHCLRLMGQTRDPQSIESSVRAFFGYHKCYLSLSRVFLPLPS